MPALQLRHVEQSGAERAETSSALASGAWMRPSLTGVESFNHSVAPRSESSMKPITYHRPLIDGRRVVGDELFKASA